MSPLMEMLGGLIRLVVEVAHAAGKPDIAQGADDLLKMAGFPAYYAKAAKKVDEIKRRFGGG